MTNWLFLIIHLPTENATARMRAWRALKGCGAAVLRDGVYLLPEREGCKVEFDAIAADVTGNGGTAYVLCAEEPAGVSFQAFFKRDDDYAILLDDIHAIRAALSLATLPAQSKQIRKLRKSFAAITETDFFPSEAKNQADAALAELEIAINRLHSPDEPYPAAGQIKRLSSADFQGRIWATRARPWVDRLASAWLIRRFIDAHAHILWLDNPADCPPDALGFDFDGASFSHIGNKVTFEVLVASFGLQQAALQRMGEMVHYLDIGGIQPPESAGVESVLAGLRETVDRDDALLNMASTVFDGLLATYGKMESK